MDRTRGGYTVDITGNIPKNSYVSVIPESEITLSSPERENVQCDVSQSVTIFRSTAYEGDVSGIDNTVVINNEDVDASGTIKTKDGQYLSSGHWEGTLNFEINLVNEDIVPATQSTDSEQVEGGAVDENEEA